MGSVPILRNPSGKTATFIHDSVGRRTKLTLPNGTTATYSYDAAGRLSSLLNQSGASVISSYSYQHDRVGNRTSLTELEGMHNYTYDRLYQLIQATHPIIPTEQFSYDPVGNRLNTVVEAGNRLLEDSDYSYSYDNNGNRTERIAKDGTLKDVYTWNAENKLIKFERYDSVTATIPITTASYKYDALGRRIEKNVNNAITGYIYDGINIIAETDGSGAITTTYTQGEGIDEPISMTRNNKTYYYHRDSLGSITSLTDEAGNVVQEYRYDSFGNITYIKEPTFVQPFTFTGREYDPESGLYFYRERIYDSYTGTFPSADPIGFAAGDVNLYRYVENNPVNRKDPLGLFLQGCTRNPYAPLLAAPECLRAINATNGGDAFDQCRICANKLRTPGDATSIGAWHRMCMELWCQKHPGIDRHFCVQPGDTL